MIKKLLPLFFSLSLLSVGFSCDTKEDPTPEETANQNKVVETWKSEKAPALMVNAAADSLFIVGYKQNGRLEMKVKFRGEGKYSFPEAGSVTYFELVGGDEVKNTYSLDSTDTSSELLISKWEVGTKTVEASFQVTLKRDKAANATGTPEVLQFKGGEVKGAATVKAPTIPDPNGKKDGEWNVREPRISIWKGTPGVDSMNVVLYNNKGVLLLQIPFTGVGKYTTGKSLLGFYYELEGDEPVVIYDLYFHEVSELEIQKWDPATKRIEGTFNVLLRKVYYKLPGQNSMQNVQNLELLRFKDSTFEGEVKFF